MGMFTYCHWGCMFALVFITYNLFHGLCLTLKIRHVMMCASSIYYFIKHVGIELPKQIFMRKHPDYLFSLIYIIYKKLTYFVRGHFNN